jgi:AcrR family transcriptional regulator
MELLEESGEAALSLRAVARHAGVSPAAPYRHYADREALLSAVAAVGYRELAERLAAVHPSPSTPEQLAEVAIAYVRFALERPALFRIMFGEPCDRHNEERAAAIAAVSLYVREIVQRNFPHAGADADALVTAIWALVHGLAFLHVDGKLDARSPVVVADRVSAAVQALLTATSTGRHPVDLR